MFICLFVLVSRPSHHSLPLTVYGNTNLYLYLCQQHGQRQPGCTPGVKQAEDADPGHAGTDLGHAWHRHELRGAAAQTPHTERASPHQESAVTEIQRLVHV